MNVKLSVVLVLVVALTSFSRAGVMTFTKIVDTPKLAAELKTATGYIFEKECVSTSCKAQGHIRAFNGKVEVYVYEGSWGIHSSTATFDAALQTAITDAVNAHVP